MAEAAFGFVATENIAPLYLGEWAADFYPGTDNAFVETLIDFMNDPSHGPMHSSYWMWGYDFFSPKAGLLNTNGATKFAKLALVKRVMYYPNGTPVPVPTPAQPPIDDGEIVMLTNVNSGLCLEIPSGSSASDLQLSQYTCTPAWWNQHYFTYVHEDGSYSLVSRHTSKCVEADAASSAGAPVRQQPCDVSNQRQNFSLIASGTDYQLKSAATGFCIGIAAESTAISALLEQQTCLSAGAGLSSSSQSWTFAPQ
jgi:hypothetical protein